MIPDGYINTNDANATADKILQGYNAYVKGEKIHGTYVPSGGGGSGGVILGTDEVVAKKLYGKAGILTGGKSNLNGISLGNNYDVDRLITLVGNDYINYIIADRKLTENVSGEIVIYNLNTNTNEIYHADPSSKYSYTYEELGLAGEVKCIAASPIKVGDYTQITIGTSVGIYTYMFEHSGNGTIGASTPYGATNKIVINNKCADYNSIAYANTNSNTFAYYDGGKIHIVKMLWGVGIYVETMNQNNDTRIGNVMALFRFSPSDRFLMCEDWGQLNASRTNIILLDQYYYIANQVLNLATGEEGYQHGQVLINSKDNFAILAGKPYSLTYDLSAKTFAFTKLSDNMVIPYNKNLNESCYATFSSNDEYVYAVSFQDGAPIGMFLLGCYKVDLLDLSGQWQLVSSLLPVGNNANMPVINIINSQILCFNKVNDGAKGFYYYYADPNIKEIIGLQYNGENYQRIRR